MTEGAGESNQAGDEGGLFSNLQSVRLGRKGWHVTMEEKEDEKR